MSETLALDVLRGFLAKNGRGDVIARGGPRIQTSDGESLRKSFIGHISFNIYQLSFD
jgi:hypothetical protein